MENIRPHINQLVSSPLDLYQRGFYLRDLPQENNQWIIAPVFTFTNASSARANDTEGFGLICLGDSWDNTIIRAYEFTQPLMNLRHFTYLSSSIGIVYREHIRKALTSVSSMRSDTLSDKELVEILRHLFIAPHFTQITPDEICCLPCLTDDQIKILLGDPEWHAFYSLFSLHPYAFVNYVVDFSSEKRIYPGIK
ncbi:hypothetical protein FJ364_04920 [Candidatus Dependentiae bacterium]|nr:hypothetical protein [Candidatus Dependentiae bacterium]